MRDKLVLLFLAFMLLPNCAHSAEAPLVIESIIFTGNSIYTSEQLMSEVSSQIGTAFNSKSLRKDLERIQEKYHKDGYIMARVSDLQIESGNIYITILEPRVRHITIQGNTRTPAHVFSRDNRLKEGDPFNVIDFRHDLEALQGLGDFEDINIAFDSPNGSKELVDITITVKDKEP